MSIDRSLEVKASMIRSVLFFGTRCSFADRVLGRLVSNGTKIAARIVPGHPGTLRSFELVTEPPNTASRSNLPMARNQNTDQATIPYPDVPTVIIHNHRAPDLEAQLRAFDADLAVVCCYTRRIPTELVAATRLGGINLHPSLLPRYRGPDPLFWIYKHGERQTGVTIHRVDSGLDTGPILAQQSINIPVGKPGNQLWNLSADRGAEMLVSLLSNDDVLESSGREQSEVDATYFSWPDARALLVKPEQWEAWRLFHFARGVVPFGYAPIIDLGSSHARVTRALDYVDLSHGLRDDDDVADVVRCRDGIVRLELERNRVRFQ
jgi:methionyl-tRNA formyltransferase